MPSKYALRLLESYSGTQNNFLVHCSEIDSYFFLSFTYDQICLVYLLVLLLMKYINVNLNLREMFSFESLNGFKHYTERKAMKNRKHYEVLDKSVFLRQKYI